jgi:hypothetical protein
MKFSLKNLANIKALDNEVGHIEEYWEVFSFACLVTDSAEGLTAALFL